jgi:diacylglycerol kinase family enzyme
MSHVSFASRRRAAALGALIAVSVGVFALINGIAENPISILVSVLSLLAAIGFGWVTLTRSGPDRRRAAWVTAILLAVAFIAAIGTHDEGWTIILGGLSIVFSLPLGRYALGRDRRSMLDLPPPAGDVVPAATKPVLLVNPLSGDGKARRLDLIERATARGIECHTFGPGSDLRDLARQVIANGADVVGVAGGDGSQAIVADLLRREGLPLVVVPSGTRNHFAMDLGLDRADPLAALDAFGPARERTVDMAHVNGQPFLNNVSMGIYGSVVQRATYRERKLETTIAELPTLVADPPQLRFTGPDGNARSTVHVVMVSNNPYLLDLRGGGGRPRLSTGELGIVTVELGGPAGVTELFARAALGSITSSPGFNAWTTRVFTVSSDSPIAAGVDGEAVELTSPAHFLILPRVLRVRIPLTAIGRSPAAFVPDLKDVVVELCRRAFLPVPDWRPLPRR